MSNRIIDYDCLQFQEEKSKLIKSQFGLGTHLGMFWVHIRLFTINCSMCGYHLIHQRTTEKTDHNNFATQRLKKRALC